MMIICQSTYKDCNIESLDIYEVISPVNPLEDKFLDVIFNQLDTHNIKLRLDNID